MVLLGELDELALAHIVAKPKPLLAHARADLDTLAENTLLPFSSVPVFHKIKFVSTRDSDIIDTVHVRPDQRDIHGHPIPTWFDTVIVCGDQQGGVPHGIQGELKIY